MASRANLRTAKSKRASRQVVMLAYTCATAVTVGCIGEDGMICDGEGTPEEKYCVYDPAGRPLCTNCEALLTDVSTSIAEPTNVGIDPPRVTIDGVPVKLKASDRVEFRAERAVGTGTCAAPDGS